MSILSPLTADRQVYSQQSITDEYERDELLKKASAKRSTISITISKWSIGWNTIFSMYSLYFLALVLAVSHLLLFQYLDGKLADQTNVASCSGLLNCATEAPKSQTYISTASILLSNAFGIAIRMSLAISFTQYLWKILRTSSLKIDTIESFFNIRSNILKLFGVSVFINGWVLVLIALVLYLIPVAISFPPGALTIETRNHNFTVPDTVLTFDPTYLGNGSFADTTDFLIPTWSLESNSTDAIYHNGFGEPNSILQRLAANIALAGQPVVMPSPCSSNCSYSFQFVGPSVKCQSDTKETVFPVSEVDIFTIFSGNWSYFRSSLPTTPEGPNSDATLNITVFKADGAANDNSSAPIPATQFTLICVPFRALYTVENTYINNEQTLAYTYTQLAQLTNVDVGLNVDSLLDNMGANFDETWSSAAQENTNWVKENLEWYRDGQLMAIITAMATVVTGSYSACYAGMQGFFDCGTDIGSYVPSGLGSYLIPYTPFNSAPQSSSGRDALSNSIPVELNITEDGLNQLLGNLTLSMIPSLGLWSETVNVTKSLSQNVFSFSHPINLILPYFLSLLLALPLLIIGTFALIQNGVPATDGGFIQILSTTTGSPILQRVAAGNCLAGEEHPSKQLRELKVRYGELVDLQVQVGGNFVRRAGFGTEDEVGPLKKGEKYGVVGKM